MMSPRPSASASPEGGGGASTSRSVPTARSTPLQVIHILGNFARIWSVYSLYNYLSSSGDSIVGFIFSCLVPASVIFLALQKPWKGRPLPNSQVVPTVINGGILALYFVLWGKGLLACGPLVALLAEYAGAVLGVLSAALYGRKVNIWKKIAGLAAMLLAYYLLANGWATRTHSPLYSFGSESLEKGTQVIGMKEMVVPLTAGILSALRRVLARRVSLKNQLKRRLHAINIASATCFLFPFAMWDTILGSASDSIVKLQFPSWTYLSTVLFGMVLIFYVDNIAEEKLHLVFSSPRHLTVSTGCIIVLEILYKMDFSLLGFLLCSVILGFGIFEATSLERSKKSPLEAHELSNGSFHNQLPISALPS
ncbi:zinc transporter 5 isoform X2 [Oryza brachyantha]|uniref:EamA domain-containing protein n=1 Tax=Oryza brachyantha TaxID=4533 RepID=J3MK12_ORYBR|nr:zinc transporter 5 isoform X2 [Oryza brachyantha]